MGTILTLCSIVHMSSSYHFSRFPHLQCEGDRHLVAAQTQEHSGAEGGGSGQRLGEHVPSDEVL